MKTTVLDIFHDDSGIAVPNRDREQESSETQGMDWSDGS